MSPAECRKKMTSVIAACPKTKFIVSGYSQGANLCHGIKATGAVKDAVSSVLLFGDVCSLLLEITLKSISLPNRCTLIVKWHVLTSNNSHTTCTPATPALPTFLSMIIAGSSTHVTPAILCAVYRMPWELGCRTWAMVLSCPLQLTLRKKYPGLEGLIARICARRADINTLFEAD